METKFGLSKHEKRKIYSLPVYEHKKDILTLLNSRSPLIVVGETGSGKTTQIPKMIFNNFKGKIAVSQPRRVAAISIALRVAKEVNL